MFTNITGPFQLSCMTNVGWSENFKALLAEIELSQTQCFAST